MMMEIRLDDVTFVFRAEYTMSVEIISRAGKWRAEINVGRMRAGLRPYTINIAIFSPEGKAYLSIETNEKDALKLLTALKRKPRDETEALKWARKFLEVLNGLVEFMLGPVLEF